MRFQERHYPGTGNELDPLLNVSSEHRKRGKAIRLAIVVSLTAASCTLIMILMLMVTTKSPAEEPPAPIRPVNPAPAVTPAARIVVNPASPSVPVIIPAISPSAPNDLPTPPPAPVQPVAVNTLQMKVGREEIPGHDWTIH